MQVKETAKGGRKKDTGALKKIFTDIGEQAREAVQTVKTTQASAPAQSRAQWSPGDVFFNKGDPAKIAPRAQDPEEVMRAIENGETVRPASWQANEDGMEEWGRELDRFVAQAEADSTARDGVWQDTSAFEDYRQKQTASMVRFRQQAGRYRDFFDSHRDIYGDREVDGILERLDRGTAALSGLGGYLREEGTFRGQFADRDEFDTYQRLQKASVDELKLWNEELDEEIGGLKRQLRERTRHGLASNPEVMQAYYERLQASIDRKQQTRNRVLRRYYELENQGKLAELEQDPEATALYRTADLDTTGAEEMARRMLDRLDRGGRPEDDPAALEVIRRELGISPERSGSTARYMNDLMTASMAYITGTDDARSKAIRSLEDMGYNYERLAEYRQTQEDAARYAKEQERIRQTAREHSILSSAASMLASPGQAVEALDMAIRSIGHSSADDIENYVPLNVYNMSATNYVSGTRGAVAEKIAENTGGLELLGVNVPSFLYQTTMSMGDSALHATLLGPVGLAFMGGEAAANQMQDIMARGGNNTQVLLGGLAAGVAEAAFEKFSFDYFLKPKTISGWKDVVKNIAVQSGIEASEEVFTEIANILSDTAIMGRDSSAELAVRAYMMQGMSREEARRQLFYDQIGQVAQAGVGGLLAGMGMGGISSTANYALGGGQVNSVESMQHQNRAEQTGPLAQAAREMHIDAPQEAAQAPASQAAQNITPAAQTAQVAAQSAAQDIQRTGTDTSGQQRTETDTSVRPRMQAAMENASALVKASEVFGENGRKAFAAAWDGQTDSAQYYAGFSTWYQAGLDGKSQSQVRGPYAGSINEAQRVAAYDSGQRDAGLSLAKEKAAAPYARTAGLEAEFVRDDYVTGLVERGELDAKTVERMDTVARELGVRVRFVDSVAEGRANGQYSDGEILIAKDAVDPVAQVLGHEITHRVQELAPEQYRAFRQAALDNLAGSAVQAKIDNYRAQGETIQYEAAMDDAAADYAGQLLEDGKLLDEFIDRHRTDKTLLQKLRDVFRGLWQKLTGAERRKAQTAEGKLAAALDAAKEQAATLDSHGEENGAPSRRALQTDGDVRYSLKAFDDGKRFVDVDTDQAQFDGLSEREQGRLATQIIKERFAGRVIGLDNRVFVNGRSASEYGFPVKHLSADEHDAKMRASTELDNLVDAGTNFRTAPDGRDGHTHPNAKGGFQYFDTIFKVGGQYYRGIINITQTGHGLLLKDVTQIENVTQAISSSYGQSPKSTILRDVSMDSVPQSGGENNPQYSLKGATITKTYNQLLRENDALRERLTYWRGQTRTTQEITTDRKAVAAAEQAKALEENPQSPPAAATAPFSRGPDGTIPSQAAPDSPFQKGPEEQAADGEVRYSLKEYAGKDLSKDGSVYTYDFLTSLPDMKVTTLPEVETVRDSSGKVDTRAVLDMGMKNARAVGTERDGNVFVRNSYTGKQLQITGESIRHGLNGGLNRLLTNARLGAMIGDLVQNAVPINALQDKAQGVTGTYAMAGYATDSSGREFVAILTVEQRTGHVVDLEAYDMLHAVSGRQKRSERADTKSQGLYPSTNASEISIADFLEAVKGTHQSILPQDVLDRFGEERNPGGYYTGKAQFSLKGTTITKTYDQLLRENDALRERLTYWRGQTRTTQEITTDRKAVAAAAKALIKDYGVQMDAGELTGRLQALYDTMASGKTDSGEIGPTYAWEQAEQIARDIAGSAVSEWSLSDEFPGLKEKLRTTRLSISHEYDGDIHNENFRREYRGKLNLTSREGTNVDAVYAELAENYPGLFPEDITHPAEQMEQIMDVADSLHTVEQQSRFSGQMEEAVTGITGEIMEGFFDLPQTRAIMADRYAAKLDKAKAHGKQRVAETREQYQERIQKLREENRQAVRNAIDRERATRQRQLQALKDRYAQSRENARGRRADSKARDRLLHIVRRLQNMKLPEVNRTLLNEYIGDLDTVAKSMTGQTLAKLENLRDWYAEQKANNRDFIADPKIEEDLKRLSKRQIGDLSAQEVADLTQVLLNIENEIRTQRKLIDSQERRDVHAAGEAAIRDIEASAGSRPTGLFAFLDKNIVTETLSPLRQVRRMTGYAPDSPLTRVTQELADGQRTMMDYQRKAEAQFARYTNDKAFTRSFAGPRAKGIQIQGMGRDGPVTVTITPAMRASLYLHSLNDQNLRHIRDGGITVPDWKLYQKGQIAEAYNRGTTVKLTPSQVRSITAHMTQKERAFALAAHRYFNVTSKEAVNAVSEKLKGYSIAQVEDYFPIRTDSSFTRADFESVKFDGTIEGMGFLKERVNAANPILLRDMSAELDQSIQLHSKYVGLAIPVRNFNKLWNVTTGQWVDGDALAGYNGSEGGGTDGLEETAGYNRRGEAGEGLYADAGGVGADASISGGIAEWAANAQIERPEGIAREAVRTVRSYGVQAVVVQDAAIKARNPNALALTEGGVVYISDMLTEEDASVGHHEAVHAVKQRGSAAYESFLDNAGGKLNLHSQTADYVLKVITNSRFDGQDLLDLTPAQQRTVFDELNAVVWGCYKADAQNARAQFQDVFTDYDGYITALGSVMEQARQEGLSRENRGKGTDGPEGISGETIRTQNRNAAMDYNGDEGGDSYGQTGQLQGPAGDDLRGENYGADTGGAGENQGRTGKVAGWANKALVQAPGGAAGEAVKTARSYGVRAVVVQDAAIKARNPNAMALTEGGVVYISDALPADQAGAVGHHEAVHAVKQRGSAAYESFLDEVSQRLDFGGNAVERVVGIVTQARFQSDNFFDLTPAQQRTVFDELNALVWGCYKADAQNARAQFQDVFTDYDGYITALGSVMEQARQEGLSRENRGKGTDGPEGISGETIRTQNRNAAMDAGTGGDVGKGVQGDGPSNEGGTEVTHRHFQYEDSVKNAVKNKWGEAGYGYIEKMMSDLQNGHKPTKPWSRAMSRLRSNYAGAVLTLNASVAMKQAASYPTAAAVLGWGPLNRAMLDVGKVDLDLIARYTPLQWYRSKGFSTQELGDMKSANRQLPTVLNWVQGVDLITTRKLWKASEYYVRGHNKALNPGTDAYYRAVADIYNQVIEETQPNYTTMQRPQLLRSDDNLLANLQMFKTQPFQNFNIVYDAAGEFTAAMRRGDKAQIKTARAKLGRAVTSQLAQLAVFAGMGMAWAMFRGKKKKYEDEDGELTTQSMLTALGKDMVGGALSGIPFGSDAWELLSSKLFGDAYYGMDAVTVQALSDTIQSLGGMGELIEGIIRAASAGEKIDWRSAGIKLDGYIDDISKAAGVPYENVANLVYAIQRQVAVQTLGEIQGEYAAMKWTVDPEKKSGEYYDLLYKALERGDLDSYFAIRAELPELLGKDHSDIDGAMKSRYTARVKKDPAYSLSERACDLLGIRAKLDNTEKEAAFSPDGLDSKTFQSFQEQRADRWRAAQVKLEGNALYGKLSDAGKDKVMNAVWEYAHQTALAEASGGKYTPTSSWIADAQTAAKRGVQPWEFALYKTAYGTDAAYQALERGNLTEYKALRGKYMDVLGKDGTGVDAAMRSEYEDKLEANPRYTLNQAAQDLIGVHPSGSSDSGDSFGADDLTRAAYDAYTVQRAADFRETVDYIEGLPSYRDMDQDTRDKLVSMAYTMAHQTALADNSNGQYSPTYQWVRDALDAQEDAGIENGEFLLWKTAYNMASSDKDENDKPIKGREKKDKVKAWLLSQEDLTPEQRAYLWGTEYKSAW